MYVSKIIGHANYYLTILLVPIITKIVPVNLIGAATSFSLWITTFAWEKCKHCMGFMVVFLVCVSCQTCYCTKCMLKSLNWNNAEV